MVKQIKYAFRMTHIDNMPHIVRCGLVRASSPLRDENYVSIGDNQVINRRNESPVNGYHLNDYIPFYFGPRSPMLYVIQHGYNGVCRVEPENIVYCVVGIDDLISNNVDCIFTDGHALSRLTTYYEKTRLPSINEIVKSDDVYSSLWNLESDPDLKRRKEAELLIKEDLSPQYVRGYAVYNEIAKQRLVDMGVALEKISIKPNYYF
ncbi:MAG: DUF4433 domain-containing protein [Lachnospiraceae bacterium]|nr:DUF4433 domain-containing protein [Lachnospiraceae bacterium]